MIKARTAAPAAAFALAALLLAGCSNGAAPTSEPTNGETTAPTTEPTPSETLSPEAEEALAIAYAGLGLPLVDIEPAPAPEGINFYVMSCGEMVATCALPAKYMMEAAEAAGWNANLVDGKLNPEGFATAIRQAIAGGADVIVPVGINCSAAAQAFAEAKAAGIVVVSGGGLDDCDPAQWAFPVRLWLPELPLPSMGFPEWQDPFHNYGYLAANYAIGKTDGDVKAITVTATTNAWQEWFTEGFEATLDQLGGGEIVEDIRISDQEVADGSFIQKVTTALLNHPEANVIYVTTDAYYENGLAAALDQAGRGDIIAIGNFGGDGAIDMIRNGQPGITATVATVSAWEAWGSIDTAIRILNGQAPIMIGQSVQVVDKDHNMPATGGYQGTEDFRAVFLESWGR